MTPARAPSDSAAMRKTVKPPPAPAGNGKPDARHTVEMSARAHIETFLGYLLDRSLILGEDWDALPDPDRERILACDSHATICEQLVACGLLTEYQSARIQNGKQYGLV